MDSLFILNEGNINKTVEKDTFDEKENIIMHMNVQISKGWQIIYKMRYTWFPAGEVFKWDRTWCLKWQER